MDDDSRPDADRGLSRGWAVPLLVVLLIAASLPRAVATYRAMAFDTFPKDDYASYLLWLVDDPDGHLPSAPAAYRIGSVLPAVPVFVLLPASTFSRLHDVDPDRLRALQALALTAHGFELFAGLLVFFAVRRLGGSSASGVAAALLSYMLFDSTALHGVDPIAICAIAGLAAIVDRPLVFVPLIVASIAVNEKIALVFAVLLLGRWASRRPVAPSALIASWLALVGVVAVRLLLSLPGGEHQLSVAAIPGSIRHVLMAMASLRGLALSLLPVGVVLALYGFARRSRSPIAPTDIAPLLALVAACLLARVDYVGRIALYAFPLYLPAAWLAIEERLASRAST